MRFLLRVGLPVGGFIALIALLAVGLQLDPREVPSPLIGKPAPELNLPKLEAADTQVQTAALQGEVWLLNVWASWCASCRDEHAVLNRFTQTHDVPIIGFNYKDERPAAKRWLQRHGDPYRFSVVDQSGRTAMDWGVYGVPETFIIDAEGIIRHKHIGPITEESLNNEIMPVLQQLQEQPA